MREAFAGVQNTEYNAVGSDLSCCAYGRACTIFADSDLAASLDSGRHLQSWLGDENVMVDRYDVRLLLHDSTQVSKASHRGAIPSSETDSLAEDLEYERYRDMNADTVSRSVSPDQVAPDTSAAGAHSSRHGPLNFPGC